MDKIIYTCRECKFPTEKEFAKVGTISNTKKTCLCKTCHNIKIKNYHIERRAKIYPQNHMVCDDCDRTFSKYQSGSRNHYCGQRLLKTSCPFCQSENIDKY
jgi:hypothetical protein